MRLVLFLLAGALSAQSVAFPGPGISRVVGNTPTLIAHTAKAGNTSGVLTDAIDSSGANFCAIGTTQFGSIVAPTDSKSNTWTALTSRTVGGATSAIYYAQNATTGSGHTFQVSGTLNFAGIAVKCFSNVKTSSSKDQDTGNAGTGFTSSKPGSVTPTEDGELIIAALGIGGTGLTSLSINLGFSIDGDSVLFNSGANYGQSLAYLVQPTAGAIDLTWSWATFSGDAMSQVATFKKLP